MRYQLENNTLFIDSSYSMLTHRIVFSVALLAKQREQAGGHVVNLLYTEQCLCVMSASHVSLLLSEI